jgi:hypothetical protein
MPPLTLTNAAPPDEERAVDTVRPTRTELRIKVFLLAGLVAAIGGL